MLTYYLQAELISYTSDQELPENLIKLHFLTSSGKLNSLDSFKNLSSSIEEILKEDSPQLWIHQGAQPEALLTIPNREFENLRQAGALVFNEFKKNRINKVQIEDFDALTDKERYAFLEGFLLSSYDFSKYKKQASEFSLQLYIFSSDEFEKQKSNLEILVRASALTKTLVNEPVNYMDVPKFTENIEQAGKEFGFETEILNKKQIEELGMGGLLNVNKGSETPPAFSILNYKPENAVNEKPLVLVGKGVTYDTGGYNVKVSNHMKGMKSDMAGGAAVVGILSAVAGNKLPYHIIGVIPATDNKISAQAMVADDVIKMMNGTTVEVLNTDAEGRLILADALTYVKRFSPELVVDMATLTGASAAITGEYGIAALGNDKEQMESLKATGEKVYERLVELPLWKEYGELLKSEIADMTNLGGPVGGVSTAAKFLEHFTDYPWIHLDIAGAAFIEKASGYKQSGGTATAVRLIYEFIQSKIN